MHSTLTRIPPANPAAADAPPQPGRAAAVRAGHALNRRVQLVTSYLALVKRGVPPDEAAFQLRWSPRRMHTLAARFGRWGRRGLKPHFTPPRPRPRPAPVLLPEFVEHRLRQCPRHGEARLYHLTQVRIFTLGRYLQLRAQGKSFRKAAREIGCGASTLFRLHQRFQEGGLLALQVKPSPGRTPKRKPAGKVKATAALRRRFSKVHRLLSEIEREARRHKAA